MGLGSNVAVMACIVGCGGNVTTAGHQDPNKSDAADHVPSVEGGPVEVGYDRNPYIPSGEVAPADDAGPVGGTTESAGFGFDLCGTRTPGKVMSVDAPPPSQGTRFLRFTTASCEGACNGPSDAQIYAWPTTSHSFDIVTGLYFDIIDLAAQPSSGSLRIYGTDEGCGSNVLVTEVPLSALAIERVWSTRCIPLRPGTMNAIGMAVTAGDYDIGIDEIRFGQGCR